jgi:hypothetical protein
MFWRIVIGIALAALGAVITVKGTKIYEWFGPMTWAERYLGAGGSRLAYRLMGILLSFVGFMVATNLWTSFMRATLGEWLNLNPKNELYYED